MSLTLEQQVALECVIKHLETADCPRGETARLCMALPFAHDMFLWVGNLLLQPTEQRVQGIATLRAWSMLPPDEAQKITRLNAKGHPWLWNRDRHP